MLDDQKTLRDHKGPAPAGRAEIEKKMLRFKGPEAGGGGLHSWADPGGQGNGRILAGRRRLTILGKIRPLRKKARRGGAKLLCLSKGAI